MTSGKIFKPVTETWLEHRTTGCVGYSIGLVSIGGYFMYQYSYDIDESTKPRDAVIRSWTLTPDLLEWKADDDMVLPLPCLWNSERLKNEGLPRRVPVKPILSKQEDGVIYLLLGDNYLDEGLLLTRILCVDMRTMTLCYPAAISLPTNTTSPPELFLTALVLSDYFAEQPDFLSAEFSAYYSQAKPVSSIQIPKN